jgi:hypothetical protein
VLERHLRALAGCGALVAALRAAIASAGSAGDDHEGSGEGGGEVRIECVGLGPFVGATATEPCSSRFYSCFGASAARRQRRGAMGAERARERRSATFCPSVANRNFHFY